VDKSAQELSNHLGRKLANALAEYDAGGIKPRWSLRYASEAIMAALSVE
jgi:hypothetical protein